MRNKWVLKLVNPQHHRWEGSHYYGGLTENKQPWIVFSVSQAKKFPTEHAANHILTTDMKHYGWVAKQIM